MKKIFSALLLAAAGFGAFAQNDDVYMFTSFHEPADEGLRFLSSEDGVHWTPRSPSDLTEHSISSGPSPGKVTPVSAIQARKTL